MLLFASSLVDTSLRVSVVILLLLCLRPVLRRWIGSRALTWLWLAIVVRLLVPLPVSAPWSLPPLLPAPALAAASAHRFHVSVTPADAPVTPRVATSGQRAPLTPTRSWTDVLAYLWLLGALLAGSRLAHGWWVVRRWSAHTLPANAHPGLQAAYLALPAELRRGVELRLTDVLDAPTLVGVLHPQIWLPRALPDTLTPAELRHVLLHELGHARHRDLLAQSLCALACCFHWFNPLVWSLGSLARTDRELACDAWVLSRDTTGTEPGTSYGHTLLKVMEGMRDGMPRALPVASMAAGKGHFALRVREIRAFRPVAPWRGVAALMVTATLVAAGTLGSAVAVAEPTPTSTPTAEPTTAAAADSSPVPSAAPASHVSAARSRRPQQVEIESKFIEIAKSSALELEKSVFASSPVAPIFQQIFARFTGRESSASPTIFRSVPIPRSDFEVLIRELNKTKGVDLLSAPRVTTKSGQKATIEITREFIYPTAFQRDKTSFVTQPVTTPTNFDKKNTGVTLEVTPTIEPDGGIIDLSVTWTMTNFDGFTDADGKPVPNDEHGLPVKTPGTVFPVFDTHTVSTVATLPPGTTVVFSQGEEHLFARKSLRFATGEAGHKVSPEETGDRLLLVFVTAKLVQPTPVYRVKAGRPQLDPSPAESPETTTAGSQSPPPQPTRVPADLPYGVPVPGKPGFVTSPYAPDAGLVDVHDFSSGQSARDPYTGKMFLVP